MIDDPPISALLAAAPVRELNGTLVRRVPLLPMIAAGPVDFLFTSGKAGRFNPVNIPCIYFAEDEATASAESVRHSLTGLQPFVTYFAEIRLRAILDLSDAATLAALGLDAAEIRAPWVGAQDPTTTQRLGAAIHQQRRISAIRFPSQASIASGHVGSNVVIFQHCIRRPDRVQILSPGKKVLQKWP